MIQFTPLAKSICTTVETSLRVSASSPIENYHLNADFNFKYARLVELTNQIGALLHEEQLRHFAEKTKNRKTALRRSESKKGDAPQAATPQGDVNNSPQSSGNMFRDDTLEDSSNNDSDSLSRKNKSKNGTSETSAANKDGTPSPTNK